MSPKTPVIEELKARRHGLGWTLQDLGERCAIDEGRLAGWEHGVGSPQLDALAGWAAALGLKLALAPADGEARQGLGIDWDRRCVSVDGVPVRLTPMEWRALERLAASAGELVPHEALYRHLYGEERPYRAESTAMRVLITKLRRLLPVRIEAQWGRGYVLSGIEPPSPGPASAGADGPAEAASAEPTRRDLPPPGRGTQSASPLAVPLRQVPAERCDAAPRGSPPPPVVVAAHRAEELRVIERFLNERGATRCPDAATIQQSPLPTLVWDKIKRKWVRPSFTDRAAS